MSARVTEDYPQLQKQSHPVRFEKMRQAPRVEVLEVEDLNKLLRLNQQLYLAKEQIFKKSERSFFYFEKVLGKKQKWFMEQQNATAKFLRELVQKSDANYKILENIRNKLVPDLVQRSGHPKKDVLESNLKLILKLESDFYKIIESADQVDQLRESRAKSPADETVPENLFHAEDSSSKDDKTTRKRSLSNKRPKKPPVIRTNGHSRKNTSSNSNAISKFKESSRLCLDNEETSHANSRGDSQTNPNHPSQGSSQMVSRTDFSDPSKEMSESFDFKKRVGARLRKLSKSISPNNKNCRRRITFGSRANCSNKKNSGEAKNGKGNKTGPGEGSILSFKNFAVMSRADSIRNSQKKTRRKSGKKKQMNLQLFDTLSSSRESNKTEKKFETSTNENQKPKQKASIEKYNVYKEIRGKSKGFYSKRNSVLKPENPVDFDLFDFSKQNSFGKEEQPVRESKETVKQAKNRREPPKKGARKKKRARKVVGKTGGIKVISKKK